MKLLSWFLWPRSISKKIKWNGSWHEWHSVTLSSKCYQTWTAPFSCFCKRCLFLSLPLTQPRCDFEMQASKCQIFSVSLLPLHVWNSAKLKISIQTDWHLIHRFYLFIFETLMFKSRETLCDSCCFYAWNFKNSCLCESFSQWHIFSCKYSFLLPSPI